ncbi:hypothetical protein FRB94_002393 [Tulasnella sp. JGI-2019a]|nr:hypothetical protein FRB94_002393 [Tulasnella sp. JGI-2019a]
MSSASRIPAIPPPQQAQRGTLLPGQNITLKHYTVTVQRHISQGGFGHIYLVETPQPIGGVIQHVLKHMHISDSVMLEEVQNEINVMRILRSHPNIVNLTDSAIIPRRDGSHEVFIMMAYADGGCIIDLMNRCLRERLSEQVILQIFVDVCEAVTYMHSFDPPLLHRDIKVENVLQAGENSYLLCDFGSTACPAISPPSTQSEIKAMEADITRHTTLQYRAPEMVDPYMRRPVDEKSDVWALGVLLYKLCYYATPFEGTSALPILSVTYTIPSYPVYSGRLKDLIASMLRDHGDARPTAAAVLEETHRLRGTRPHISCRQHQRHGLNIPMPRPVPGPVPNYRPDQKLVHSPNIVPPIPHYVTSMSSIQRERERSMTLPPPRIQVPPTQISAPVPPRILSPVSTVMPRPRSKNTSSLMVPPSLMITSPTPSASTTPNAYYPWTMSGQETPTNMDPRDRRHHHMNQTTLNMIPPHMAPPPNQKSIVFGLVPPSSSRSTSHLPTAENPGHSHRYLPPPPSPLGSSSSSSSGSESPRQSISRQSSQSSAFGAVRSLGRPMQVK